MRGSSLKSILMCEAHISKIFHMQSVIKMADPILIVNNNNKKV